MIAYKIVQNMCDKNAELATIRELAEVRQWIDEQLNEQLENGVEEVTIIIRSSTVSVGGYSKSVRGYVRCSIVQDFKDAGYSDKSSLISVHDFSVKSVF